MKVLVCGGTGVVGRAAVNALLRAGHEVRLASRHAEQDAEQWPRGVEAVPADLTRPETLGGCAVQCGAVLHIAGIVREDPPDLTFERVNVGGAAHLLEQAASAGAPRFVYVSSLGAERGTSDYHRSKRAAERLVEGYPGNWTIVRPGNVYGPGDDVISLLLRLVRTLPVVPVLGDGEQRFQPIWHEDLGAALARCVEREDLGGRTLELSGADVTTPNEVLDIFAEITGRRPVRLPIPQSLAQLALDAAEHLGADLPINTGQLTMLLEENVLGDPADNALTTVFGVPPTPLRNALTRLADEQPEQLPEDGIGRLARRVFEVEIRDAARAATELCADFRTRFGEFVPLETAAEPGTSAEIGVGAVLTLALPGRGNIQVRVEESEADRVTLVTLAGHPLAGSVTFRFEEMSDAIRFAVDVLDRPASRVDQVAMTLFGEQMQASTWREVCQRVLEASGGHSTRGVQSRELDLDGAEALRAEKSLAAMVNRRRRRQENRV